MNLFCFHRKWSEVDAQGYQYCEYCHKAIQAPPPPPPPPCQHKKKTVIDRFQLTGRFSGTTSGYVYVLSCNECGELINHQVKGESDLSNFVHQQQE